MYKFKNIKKPKTKEDLIDLNYCFFISKTVQASVSLGVFDALSEKAKDPIKLAKEINVNERAIQFLLDALFALGLVTLENDKYISSEISQKYLTSKPTGSIAAIFRNTNYRTYDLWSCLEDAIKTGEPQITKIDNKNSADFAHTMSVLSSPFASAISKKLKLDQSIIFCDVGGGIGTVAREVALNNRDVICLNVDFPRNEAHFNNYNKNLDITNLEFVSCNVLKESLPIADIFCLHNFLRDFGVEERVEILTNCYTSLRNAGKIIISDPFVGDFNEDNLAPYFQAINMLLNTDCGGGYSYEECRSWLEKVGFKEARLSSIKPSINIIEARK